VGSGRPSEGVGRGRAVPLPSPVGRGERKIESRVTAGDHIKHPLGTGPRRQCRWGLKKATRRAGAGLGHGWCEHVRGYHRKNTPGPRGAHKP